MADLGEYGIEPHPHPLSDDRLSFLAGFALGLRGTRAAYSVEDAQQIGRMMLELLGHIAARQADA